MKTRVFTCNREGWPYPEVQNEINTAKSLLAKGSIHTSSWSCGNIIQIQVGDYAYFCRVGSDPRGFFAYGRVIAAETKYQSRLTWLGFQDLSEAYSNIHEDLRVTYEWYSVVDYDKTLSTKSLKNAGKFDDYKFLFKQSGGSFNEKYIELLNSYWRRHVLEMSKQGYGAYISLPT